MAKLFINYTPKGEAISDFNSIEFAQDAYNSFKELNNNPNEPQDLVISISTEVTLQAFLNLVFRKVIPHEIVYCVYNDNFDFAEQVKEGGRVKPIFLYGNETIYNSLMKELLGF